MLSSMQGAQCFIYITMLRCLCEIQSVCSEYSSPYVTALTNQNTTANQKTQEPKSLQQNKNMTANLETRQFGFQKKKTTTANSETQQPN